VIDVRRADDNELCGAIREANGSWAACAIFGAVLADGMSQTEATNFVLEQGLATLSEPWAFIASPGEEEQVVRIVEASPSMVRLALGFYSLPGVPTVTLTSADLENGVSLRPWR
jgi:hypothetical protein